MSNPQIHGQDLIDALRIRLGALSNAFTVDQYLSFLNDGVQEVWSVIRSLDLDYFADFSQDIDTTADDYLIDLSTTQRDYDLPKNCRELRNVECLTTNYATREFEFHQVNDPVYSIARRGASAEGPGFTGIAFNTYYYTIFGTKWMLAQFPEATLQLKFWYIKAVDDISSPDDSLPDILHPFNKKIVDYTAEKMMLSMQNLTMAAAWKLEWSGSVKTLALTAGERVSTNPIFIYDFLG